MSPESITHGNGFIWINVARHRRRRQTRDHFADTRHPCHATDQEYLVDLIHFICASCIAISHIVLHFSIRWRLRFSKSSRVNSTFTLFPLWDGR